MTQIIDDVEDMKVAMKDEIKSVDDKNLVNMEVNVEEVSGKGMMEARNTKIIVNNKKTDEMEVMNGMAAPMNNAKGMAELSMIEKERNGSKKLNVGSSDEIQMEEKKLGFIKLEETTAPLATEGAVVAEVNDKVNEVDDTQTRRVDLERAGIERLSEIERLAEKKRQAKIRRREELDRIARLQRILALVREPELDSVAKIKQQTDLEPLKETKSNENMNVLKELGVDSEMNKKVVSLGAKETRQPIKSELGAMQVASMKQIAEYEGIGKLERMSKEERILEIDHLISLEIEAEMKRKADMENVLKLEREAELRREAKMKQLTEFNIKAELEEAEKEPLEAEGRQETIRRREELDRVAKLQRVLVMVRTSEADRVAEMKQADLKRSADIKRREDIELLEQLGILPRQQVAVKDSATEMTPVEKSKVKETDFDIVEGFKLMKRVKDKDIDTVNGIMPVRKIKQGATLTEVEEVDTIITHAEQSMKEDNKSKKEVIPETHKNRAVERHAITYFEERNPKQERDRVANMQRMIATVHNAEPDVAAHSKQDIKLEKANDLKQTLAEEIKLLEELGIVPKETVKNIESEADVKSSKDPHLKAQVQPNKDLIHEIETKPARTEVGPVAEVNGDIVISTNKQLAQTQIKTKMEMVVDPERDAKINRAAEMERNAKLNREARLKRREEQERVANLQRVVALVPNEEFDHVANMKEEEVEGITNKKHREDIKVLEELGVVSNKEADKNDKSTKTTNIADEKLKTDSEDEIDFVPKNVEKVSKRIRGKEPITQKERESVKEDVERRIAQLRVAQMKRVAELGQEMKAISELEQKEKKQLTETEHIETNAKMAKHVHDSPLDTTQPELKRKTRYEVSKTRHNEGSMPKTDLGFSEEEQKVAETVEIIKIKEDSNSLADLEIPNVKQEGLKSEKQSVVSRLLEMKPESEMKLVKLTQLEMKRVVAMERVRGRDCEWDGQMMYVGRENL